MSKLNIMLPKPENLMLALHSRTWTCAFQTSRTEATLELVQLFFKTVL